VTAFIPNELIEYRICSPTLLRHHLGRLQFSEDDADACVVHYEIHFDSIIPGLGPALRNVLERNIAKGLATAETRA
jgi:hypothetical protein